LPLQRRRFVAGGELGRHVGAQPSNPRLEWMPGSGQIQNPSATMFRFREPHVEPQARLSSISGERPARGPAIAIYPSVSGHLRRCTRRGSQQ
jgi:hypothetical protein